MPRIKSGKMRHRVQVIEWTVAQDDYGEETRTDSVQRTFNAQIIPISSKEQLNGGQEQGYATHRMICRYNPNQPLESVSKLQHDSRTFQVVSLTNIDEYDHKVVALLREVID